MEGQRHFPNELWLQIFAYLQFTLELFVKPDIVCPSFFATRLTLARVARVCKNFNALATPLLYHSLPISYLASSRFRLARTLIARPDLAQMVQEADIRVSYSPGPGYTRETEYVEANDLMDAITAARSTCSESMWSFFEFLQARIIPTGCCSTAEHTVFFLYMLPNLRVAELECTPDSRPMMDIIAAWPNSLMQKVEDLRINDDLFKVHRLPVRGTGLGYLPQLPSVRTLHGCSISWREYKGPLLDLRHLLLHRFKIDTSGMLSILSHCPHLETLQINLEKTYEYYIDFSEVGDMLRALGQNLEKLDIGPLPEYPKGRLGSLSTLTRLRQLTLPWDMVVGKRPKRRILHPIDDGDESAQGIPRLIDLVPNSLEHLHLYLDERDVDDWQLLELLKSDRFSKLQSVRIARKMQVNRYYDDEITPVQEFSRLGWALGTYEEHGWIWGHGTDDCLVLYYGVVLERKQT